MNSIGTHNRAATKDHGHSVARKRSKLAERWDRPHGSGLLIPAVAMEAVIKSVIGPNPPPTRKRMMESRNRTTPPFFFSTNTAAPDKNQPSEHHR